MRSLRFWLDCSVLSVGMLLGFGLRTSQAVPEFEAEFKAMYYKPDYNAKAKAFAAAVDAVSVETPGTMGRRMAACNVCHIAGRPKRERNDYGQALDTLLDRRADARNKQKIQEALKTVAKMKKNGTNVSFFELIGQGKLPGGDAH